MPLRQHLALEYLQKANRSSLKGIDQDPLNFPVVPGSDGAGEVIEIGSKVTEFQKGDRVVTLFNQGHQYGDIDFQAAETGLGGQLDGVLREYAAFDQTGLVRAPTNLNPLETSTLSCAALTSWNALYGLRPLKPGQIVLVQGTGGVSVFGLQVCTYNRRRIYCVQVGAYMS